MNLVFTFTFHRDAMLLVISRPMVKSWDSDLSSDKDKCRHWESCTTMRVQRAFHPIRNIRDTWRKSKTVYAKNKINIFLTFDPYQDVHCICNLSFLTVFFHIQAGFIDLYLYWFGGNSLFECVLVPQFGFLHFVSLQRPPIEFVPEDSRLWKSGHLRLTSRFIRLRRYTFKNRGTCTARDNEGVKIDTKRLLRTKAPKHTQKNNSL